VLLSQTVANDCTDVGVSIMLLPPVLVHMVRGKHHAACSTLSVVTDMHTNIGGTQV
jgi:hypothetical protein